MTLLKKYLYSAVEWLIFAFLIFVMIITIFFNNYKKCFLDGVSLWYFTALPALFPYFFISAILTKLSATKKVSKIFAPLTKKAFNVSGYSGYAFLISLLSGYPVGAKMVADGKNTGFLSEVESERASAFCSTSSPAFLIGVVGTVMANDILFGVLLFIVHFLSSVIVGFIFSFYKKKVKEKTLPIIDEGFKGNILQDATYSSIISILSVGALISIFYFLTQILLDFKILSPLVALFSLIFKNDAQSKSLAVGLLESTNGLKMLFSTNITFFTLPIASFICGFGGLSVIMQSIAFLKSAKIKTAPLLLGKVLAALINFILSVFISLIFYL